MGSNDCAKGVFFLMLATAASLFAQQPPAPAPVPRADTARGNLLDTVKVQGRADDLTGIASSASEGRVGKADLRSRPILREGELLEAIPGMAVTQHSGDGKANQYFIRGFNLDHGTDFQTRVEGMPLNMPTHGHGQGYTDLGFLVPEFVDHITYRLGVYHAELGDFGSAGAAEFHLLRSLDRPIASVGGGEHGLARFVAGASTRVGPGQLLGGGELKTYDGPWERAQRLRKGSAIASYALDRGRSRYSLLALAYANRWDATDQIPIRAVASGAISRFGVIDSTDGGSAQRLSLSGSWRRLEPNGETALQAYGIRSGLELFSNFTYFLNDPLRGDQFEQVDRRTIVGGSATRTRVLGTRDGGHRVRFGLEVRADFIGELGLHHTQARQRFNTVRADRVRQSGTGIFVATESRWAPRIRSVLGLRADGYLFHVRSDRRENSGNRRAGILSPKASLVYALSGPAELYVSGGYGFHSNDARGTTITRDPASGAPTSPVDPLVRSRGVEAGLRMAPLPTLRSTVTFWALSLDSELLFVGDAGSTEASGSSRRRGVTWANFYRPYPHLAVDADFSLSRARLEHASPADRIPGSLESVVAGGATWMPPRGIVAALRLRRFGGYPLVEDNSVRADASAMVNAEVGFRFAGGFSVNASLLNVLNDRASDIQYFYASRLAGEADTGVGDVHFHPVEPRQLRTSLRWGM